MQQHKHIQKHTHSHTRTHTHAHTEPAKHTHAHLQHKTQTHILCGSWMDWNLSSKVFFFKVNNKKTNQKYHSTMKRALQAIITFSFEWNLYTYTIAFRIMSCKLRELFIHSTLFHGFYKERNHLIGNSWKKKKKKTKKISLFTRFFF